jgi:hypothetical protein
LRFHHIPRNAQSQEGNPTFFMHFDRIKQSEWLEPATSKRDTFPKMCQNTSFPLQNTKVAPGDVS